MNILRNFLLICIVILPSCEQKSQQHTHFDEQATKLKALVDEQKTVLAEQRKIKAYFDAKVELATRRKPFVDGLAVDVAQVLRNNGNSPFPKPAANDDGGWQQWYSKTNQWNVERFIAAIDESGVLAVEPDQEFEKAAISFGERFIEKNCDSSSVTSNLRKAGLAEPDHDGVPHPIALFENM